MTIVLLSGGLDSTVALAEMQARNDGNVFALSIVYGQKHGNREIEAAQDVANYYNVPWNATVLPEHFFRSGALTGNTEMPHASYEELQSTVGPSPTYVPFRNGTMISLAVAYAIVRGSDRVVIAAHAEDAHNFAYPDCTPEFMGAMAAAIYVGSYHQVRLEVPFQNMSKADIVKHGWNLGAPLENTWSCYEGGEVHCGVCPTCVGRKAAFRYARVDDPTTYAL